MFGNGSGLLPEGGLDTPVRHSHSNKLDFCFFFLLPLAGGFLLLEAGELQLLTAVLTLEAVQPDRSEGKTRFPGEKSLI